VIVCVWRAQNIVTKALCAETELWKVLPGQRAQVHHSLLVVVVVVAVAAAAAAAVIVYLYSASRSAYDALIVS